MERLEMDSEQAKKYEQYEKYHAHLKLRDLNDMMIGHSLDAAKPIPAYAKRSAKELEGYHIFYKFMLEDIMELKKTTEEYLFYVNQLLMEKKANDSK